jgi:thiol-disulfide isomerase/thioredoxin
MKLARLSPALQALFLMACDGAPSAPAPEAARVVSVAAKEQSNVLDLCDKLKVPSASEFSFPTALEGTPKPRTSGWRWINVWATWCSPCTEELPLITRFQGELSAKGTPVSLELISVDLNNELIQKFGEAHPEAKQSLRVTDPSALEPWLVSLGLDAGATLPVHIFVDPSNKVRCVRTGALNEPHLPLLKKLLSGT